MDTVTHELKPNLQLLVDEGVLSALKCVLKLNGQEDLQATAARLLWSLAHDAGVKMEILKDADITGALQSFHSLPSLKLNEASHCALWLLEIQTEGNGIG